MTGTPGSESAWLDQLVGTWNVTFDMNDHRAWREEARSIGGGWIVTETSGEMSSGREARMAMILGYDPAKKQYVASTAVSMMSNLWVSEGALDETGKVLTLECEGPDLDDAGRTARYRDIITIIDADTRTFSSITQGADGAWKPVMSSVYKRLPAA